MYLVLYMYIYVFLMRDERKKEASKVKQTRQSNSTPKAVTFPRKNAYIFIVHYNTCTCIIHIIAQYNGIQCSSAAPMVVSVYMYMYVEMYMYICRYTCIYKCR